MTNFPAALVKGYHQFKDGGYQSEKARYETLAENGQKPEVMMISCCDSRAAPEIVFNTSPGDVFVVRNVANLVQPYSLDESHQATASALEYAVQVLKVKHIVVMGHARCGGIAAALDPDLEPLSPGDFVGKWIGLLAPEAESLTANASMTAQERQTSLERKSILNSIQNLRTFPYVSSLEDKGDLQLHGAWFDISSGELLVTDEAGNFKHPSES